MSCTRLTTSGTSPVLLPEDDMVVSRDTYRIKHTAEFQGIQQRLRS